MLAEGFLRILLYREERKLASAPRRSESHAKDARDCDFSTTDSSDAGRDSGKTLQYPHNSSEVFNPPSTTFPSGPYNLNYSLFNKMRFVC